MDLNKNFESLGLKKIWSIKQPCKSNNEDVVFSFVDTREYCIKIPNSNVDPLENDFQLVKNGGPSVKRCQEHQLHPLGKDLMSWAKAKTSKLRIHVCMPTLSF